MSMTVRAKFVVESKDPGTYGNVRMGAVYSTDPKHENKTFWDATPSGSIQMWINNPTAFEQFSVGDEIYVDFSTAPKDVDFSNCPVCNQYHVKLKKYEDADGFYAICPTTGKDIRLTD